MWVGVIDDYDGWAARSIDERHGRRSTGPNETGCGSSDYGNWLDHQIVDKAGELYSLLVVVALYPEFKPYWSVVILRQSFLSGDDSQEASNSATSSTRWSQVVPFSLLVGCVHHLLTIVSIVRLLANLFVDVLVTRSERRAGKADHDQVTTASRAQGLLHIAQGTDGHDSSMLSLFDAPERDAKAHHSWRSRLEEGALRFLGFKGTAARVLLSPVFVYFGITFLVWHSATCACGYACQKAGLQ